MRAWLIAVLLAPALAACAPGGATCGEGQAAPQPGDEPGAFLYQPDAVLDIEIFLDAEAIAALPTSAGQDHEDVPATLRFEGQEWSVGLRLKGDSSFRKLERKAAFKIDFGQWDASSSFHGVRRLTLNNMVQDESMLSESISYWLHALTGGPAPRHGYACVRVNGDAYGLYSVVETMDEQFVERCFDDPSGKLYEGGKGADLRAGREQLFEVEEDGDPPGRGDLAALIDALDASSPETYLEALDQHFVLEELLGFFAVALFVGDIDTYITRSNNFLLYHQPASASWSVIPWGADQAFQDTLDPRDPYDPKAPAEHGRLYEDCLASSPCFEALTSRIHEVAALAEDLEMFQYAVQQRDLIAELSRSDPRSDASRAETRRAQSALLRFIEARPAGILEQLQESP